MSKKTKKKKNPQKTATIVIFALIAAFLVFCIAGANFLFSFALDRDSSLGMEKLLMKQVSKEDSNAEDASSQQYSGFSGTQKDKAWFEKSTKDVYVTSDDGLKLHGYFAENKKSGGKYIIVFHGYSSEAKHMKGFMKKFYDMGFSVLAPDARAHGTSEGSVRGMGWLERKDALCWINSIIEKDKNCKIGLFGVSMGGATVMMTAGEELPEQVAFAIEDCGYSSVWDEFEFQLKTMFHLPSFPLLDLARLVTKIRGGYDFREASSVEQLKKCKIPMLFIHGENDDFVPVSMVDKVYEAADCSKQKLIVSGAGHALSSSTEPELYWRTVQTFLNGKV